MGGPALSGSGLDQAGQVGRRPPVIDAPNVANAVQVHKERLAAAIEQDVSLLQIAMREASVVKPGDEPGERVSGAAFVSPPLGQIGGLGISSMSR